MQEFVREREDTSLMRSMGLRRTIKLPANHLPTNTSKTDLDLAAIVAAWPDLPRRSAPDRVEDQGSGHEGVMDFRPVGSCNLKAGMV